MIVTGPCTCVLNVCTFRRVLKNKSPIALQPYKNKNLLFFVRLFPVLSITYIWPSTLCTYFGWITVQYNTDVNLNQIKFYLHSKSYNVVKMLTSLLHIYWWIHYYSCSPYMYACFSNSCSIFTLLNHCEKKSIINVWMTLFSVADWSITQLCLNPWVR